MKYGGKAMQNKAVLVLILYLSIICESLSSQANTNFLIISFELKRSIESKAIDKFYWITSIDSINKPDFCLFPLYLTQYSKDNLDRCIKGDTIDIFTRTTSTQYNFDEGYEKEIDNLIALVNNRKVKVQSITAKWDNGIKENINVYATPIIGKFCNCIQSHATEREIDFKGLAFIPVSGFKFDDSFWVSDKSKVVKFANYTSVDFSSYLLLYRKSVLTKYE